ncbi:hypothetical protein DIPPA_06020 [Diplonema papillatum]|nr:hypothetical protein DIPPA_06020 [Diplonema papillatum]
MRRALFVLAAALAGLESAHGHICLTSLMMRGAHPPLYPGDKLCYQRTPPCGALVKGPPTATYIAGNPTVITFMQNLNHWWTPKPGHFDLAVSYDDGAEWVMLGEPISDFPANNMNTQTFFEHRRGIPEAGGERVGAAEQVQTPTSTSREDEQAKESRSRPRKQPTRKGSAPNHLLPRHQTAHRT